MNKTPKLRFKEFSGNWEKAILGDRAYIKGRIGWKNLKQEEYTKKGPYLIAGKHIKNGIIDWDKCDHISIDRYNESPEIALKDDDIIFSKDGSLGNPAIIEDLKSEATINGTMMLVRLDNTFIYPKYFYYILNSRYFEKLINELKSGSSIPHIFQRDIVSFKFPITEIKEQEKIASFFSLIDDKISLQSEKVEAFKDYKKGMMQKIFSRELRFKDDDGRDYPEWEEKKLGDITSLVKDGSHGTHADVGEGPYLLSAKNIKDGKIIITDNERKISKEDYNKIHTNYRLEKGDILLSIVGTIGRLAIASEVDNITFQRSVAILRFKSMNEYYIIQFMGSIGFQNELLTRQVVSAQPGIYLNDLKKIKIAVPCIEEQAKIAKLLNSIDRKNEKEQEKLDHLNKYKKGLLQQMLV